MSATDIVLIRAAASSSASGMPSSRMQTEATAAALAGSRVKSACW